MNIRFFQPGDEFAQLKIFNTAAAGLPKFKPATILEIQRRTQANDFDPASRFVVTEGSSIVGYCNFQPNGRISYPWCLPGFEEAASPLFEHTLRAMKQRSFTKAFTAYRKDWAKINGFFQQQRFALAREMINYVLEFDNMPTPSARLSSTVTPASEEDIPGIFELDPSVFRATSAAELRAALWNNPYISHDSLYVMRNRGGAPVAAGIFITASEYADPHQVDASMPCFRLGAFGTEGMTTKRLRGLFSFVTRPDHNIFPVAMDLLTYATNKLCDEDEISCYAAQVASDAPALAAFYQRVFEKQGSFPVLERSLSSIN